MPYELTDKALFPMTDGEAIRQLANSLSITQDFLEPFVRAANDDPDALALWDAITAMTKAVTVYSG